MERLTFIITEFKIEFLLPFTGCRKVLEKMTAYMTKLLSLFHSAQGFTHKKLRMFYTYIHEKLD